MLTHDAVQAWLDAYVDAWRTYDPEAIGALFAKDATYAYHPYDKGEEVLRGREAIVADWVEEPDDSCTWEANYRPLVIEGRWPRGPRATRTATSTGTCGRCASMRRTDAPST